MHGEYYTKLDNAKKDKVTWIIPEILNEWGQPKIFDTYDEALREAKQRTESGRNTCTIYKSQSIVSAKVQKNVTFTIKLIN